MQITKLLLDNFRNFASKKFSFSQSLVLFVGINGAGKTNILEALTLLGRNSSLRGADFEEMIFFDKINDEKKSQFAIYAEISNHQFIEKIGLSFCVTNKKKIFEINGEPFKGKRQAELKSYLINFIALTPQLEQLFISGKSARRDYLDKIVSDLDSWHLTRINNYQKLLKERLLILQKYNGKTSSAKWLDIIENQIVELGIAIAFARIEAIDFFNRAITSFSSSFPKPKLIVKGDIEELALKQSAVVIEEFYKEKLLQNRAQDLANFKTDFGVHRGDFDAILTTKNMSAIYCSTGEQKSIMIGITLARAKISANYKNQPTILIFDEVVSHLDNQRKSDLFAEIKLSNLPTFLSATSKDLVPQQFLENNSIQIIEI
ncbi:MAG: AAA family ATPase [Rickettsiales bacterium]|nr:AAA family ATPase [Rickettsiales bacterium]